MRTLTTNKKHHTQRDMFFDGNTSIARYDELRYPWLDKLSEKQIGFFWRPEEIDILRDSNDFAALTIDGPIAKAASQGQLMRSAQ